MSTITLPAQFVPRSVSMVLAISQRVLASPFGGGEQAVDLLNDRWLLTAELPDSLQADGAWREAFIGNMRGQANVVALWHMMRPEPRGTMRGTLTLNAAVAQGAATISVTGGSGQAGTTLLAGDMLGAGGLLFMVGADCVADGGGIISVQLINRVRAGLSSGAGVTWDKPTTLFRLLSAPSVVYVPGMAAGPSFEFGEAIGL